MTVAVKQKKFDAKREVRRLARERLGAPPPAREIQPKTRRKKPKHKREIVEYDT